MSSLVKSNRFTSLGSMMEDFWNTDKFFNQPFFAPEILPAVNISEKPDHFEVEVAAPGFKKEDFKITTEDGLLTISAETKTEKNEEKENYTRREFSCSSFTRTFNLPDNIQQDKINAKYDNGVLTIGLKKSAKGLSTGKEVKVV